MIVLMTERATARRKADLNHGPPEKITPDAINFMANVWPAASLASLTEEEEKRKESAGATSCTSPFMSPNKSSVAWNGRFHRERERRGSTHASAVHHRHSAALWGPARSPFLTAIRIPGNPGPRILFFFFFFSSEGPATFFRWQRPKGPAAVASSAPAKNRS